MRLSKPRIDPHPTIAAAALALLTDSAIASSVSRPLAAEAAHGFSEYVASRPRSFWPEAEDCHPYESVVERVAIIDFSHAAADEAGGAAGDGLAGAIGYGRDLPPRFGPAPASARDAIAHVLRVLPAPLAHVALADATELLLALRAASGRRQFILRLGLVCGDSCLKWHSDNNIARALITFAGPGTLCAHEAGVTRAPCADASCADAECNMLQPVAAVDEAAALQMGLGDALLMKGSAWSGPGAAARGAAHRAPKIGAVGEADQHRLVLKVDISEDF